MTDLDLPMMDPQTADEVVYDEILREEEVTAPNGSVGQPLDQMTDPHRGDLAQFGEPTLTADEARAIAAGGECDRLQIFL